MAFGRAMCGVLGQYFFAFKIEGVGDFLGESGNIIEFVMEEKVGGDVPAFKLVFRTTDASVLKSLNEGADVECSFGKSLLEHKTAQMTVQKFSNKTTDSEFIEITVMGLLKNGVEYLRHPEQKSYKDKTSVEVMEEVAGKYFNVWNQTTSGSDDKMTWIRPNHSTSKFMDDLWRRSYISDNNSLMFGLEMDGWFRITDIEAIMRQQVKWGLQLRDPSDSGFEAATTMALASGSFINPANIAPYNPNIELTSDFGLLNNTVIHKKITPIHSIEDGADREVETPELKPSFVSGALNIMSDAPVKYEIQKAVDTYNLHDNYSKSRLVNVPKQTMTNSVELNIVLENVWQDYWLFDLIYFNPWRPKQLKDFFAEAESLGGMYMITKISRFFANNRAAIKITISRDGMNGMEGDLFSFF